ncbi:cytochrome P450 [Coprinopsis marcescibilis]|uniref:Cytochrome P450 n=1 Tax=Coprinopsis marcescibilis TaxID=230819 RepID=A0A5C3KKE8_COPMA|nr:cytochrome P450 [Coprinopsis marcescibilis]
MPLFFLLKAAGLYTFTRITWSLIRRLVFGHPFDVIPGPVPKSFFGGHLGQLFSNDALPFQKELGRKYGSVLKVAGLMGGKALFVSDPLALHHIFVKDADVYEETEVLITTNKVLFGEGLLSTIGEKHRKQRKLLNPVFSTTNLRKLVPTFWKASGRFSETLVKVASDGPKEVDLGEWLPRVALELIGQSALGHSFDSLTETYAEHPLSAALKRLVPVGMKLLWARFFVIPFVQRWNLGGKRLQRFVVDVFGWDSVQQLKDIADLIHETSKEILAARQKAMEAGAELEGKDILALILRANIENAKEDRMPEEEVIAQISTFVFGGLDTTSSALSRVIHLLTQHESVQDRLREEILEARNTYGELDYDQLCELPYLDAVCRETLRVYPPIPLLPRETVKDAVLPFSKPIKTTEGKLINEIVVPAGSRIYNSILNSNCDTDVWGPDGHQWKPERWLSTLEQSVTDARIPGVYSNMMTFIGGRRSCLGFMFAQLEMKAVLFSLLERLRFGSGGKEITWNMSGIVYPSVGTNKLRPELPLVVSLVK